MDFNIKLAVHKLVNKSVNAHKEYDFRIKEGAFVSSSRMELKVYIRVKGSKRGFHSFSILHR